jgi:hypothetical protein
MRRRRKAVEEVEERLFGEMDCSGLKSAAWSRRRLSDN